MEALGSAFVLGLGSAASPCLLPLYPGFISYLAANGRSLEGSRVAGLLGLAVLAGVLSAMILVAGFVMLLALPMSSILRIGVPLIDAILIGLGLLLVLGRNPFARFATIRVPVVRHPIGQAYVYGLFLGPIALPCAGPFLVAILAISLGVADALTRVAGFVAYGLGFGLPLVALSFLSAAQGRTVAGVIAERYGMILRLAGVLLMAAGLWDLAQNWPSLGLAALVWVTGQPT
jgi:cytochrome c-type biogenesis protein